MVRHRLEAADEIEMIAMEQAQAMVRELKRLADITPDGHVLAVVESAAVDRGRRFLRDRLQDVLNAQAADLEKKGGAVATAPAADPARATDRKSGGSSPPLAM
jgi:hypothetical protein